MGYTESELHKMIDEINQRNQLKKVEVEVKLDGNGDEYAEDEEYIPDFDDDFQARHFHPHDDHNYQYFA